MKIKTEIYDKERLQYFTKSVNDLREDYHEADGLVSVKITGTKLDNAGCDGEIMIHLKDNNKGGVASIRLATLLGLATDLVEMKGVN